MPVSDIQLHWTGSTGTWARNPELSQEYTSVYRCRTSFSSEQAGTVIAHFHANVTRLGSLYAYGADNSTGTISRCQRIRAQREPESRYLWIVTVEYGVPQDDKGLDVNGEPVTDPLLFRPELTWSTNRRTGPVWKSKFLGGYKGEAARLLPLDKFATPMNSTLVPFTRPAPERDFNTGTLTIRRNLFAYDADAATALENHVNIDKLVVRYLRLTVTLDKHQAKIQSVGASLRRQNDRDFWEAHCTIEKRPETWVEAILDRGTSARALDGDPDGAGGYYSPSDGRPEGIPKLRRLMDAEGEPVTEPILLDGDGQPLEIDKPGWQPVYGQWLHYPELQFRQFFMLQGLV